MSVSIHQADEQEKIQAFRNAHESWGDDTPVDEWVERRRESPRHQRADWWVLTDHGDVASSLAAYSLQFRYDGELVEGFGIGAVHTHPDYRGRGYATQLSRRVQRACTDSGAQIGLLFTDIDPGFYERVGYSTASDRRFDTEKLRGLAEGGPRAGLHPIEPQNRLDELMIWYDDWHSDRRLYLERGREYWEKTIRETTDHEFFGISRPSGRENGYVRVRDQGETLEILEMILPDRTDRTGAAAYAAIADLALARDWLRLRQYFAPPRTVLSYFDDNRRDEAITMLVPAGDEVAFDENWLRANAAIWPSDKF